MKPIHSLICTLMFCWTFAAWANPVALVFNAKYIEADYLENIDIAIENGPEGLCADFLGDYQITFSVKDPKNQRMDGHGDKKKLPILFPVPVNAASIKITSLDQEPEMNLIENVRNPTSARTTGQPLAWHKSRKGYPTIFKEMPTATCIEWTMKPKPVGKNQVSRFLVNYKHNLIRRGDGQLLFYAMGIWKIGDGQERLYEHRKLKFKIQIPDGFYVNGVFLDERAIPFYFDKQCLLLNLDSDITPLNQDLIVSIEPMPSNLRVIAAYPLPGYGGPWHYERYSRQFYSYPEFRNHLDKGIKGEYLLSLVFSQPIEAVELGQDCVEIIRSGHPAQLRRALPLHGPVRGSEVGESG